MRSSGLGEGGGRGGRPNPNPHWLDADMQCCTPTREAGKGSASVRRLSLSLSHLLGRWRLEKTKRRFPESKPQRHPLFERGGVGCPQGSFGRRRGGSAPGGRTCDSAAPPDWASCPAPSPCEREVAWSPGLNFLDAERGRLAPSPTGLSPSCANNPRSYLRWPTLAVLRVRGPRGRRVSPGRGEPGRVDRKRVGKGLGAD